MTKQGKRGLLGALAVAALALMVVMTRGSCQEPPPPPAPSAPVTSAEATPAEPPASASAPVVVDLPTYDVSVEPSSVILAGARVGKRRFRVPFETFSGVFRLNGNQVTGSALELEIQAASIEASEEDLEAQLESKELLEVERHPRVTFVSTRFEEKKETDASASYELSGNLSFHGVLKHVVVPATIAVSDEEARIDFEIELLRSDFGIQAGPDDAIGNDLMLELHLELRRADPR